METNYLAFKLSPCSLGESAWLVKKVPSREVKRGAARLERKAEIGEDKSIQVE